MHSAYDVIDRAEDETMLCGLISSGVNNGAGYRFRVLHLSNPPEDMNSSINAWNAYRPNFGRSSSAVISANICELAASEQVVLHPGTTLANGSNAWIHLVPITQAAAN